jgi:hypothetical protein
MGEVWQEIGKYWGRAGSRKWRNDGGGMIAGNEGMMGEGR